MSDERVLVFLFLRGGLDGLNAVIPTFEDDYFKRRPTLGSQRRKAGETTGGAIPLDERFALAASLEPLLPAFREGRLAALHAVGSDDDTLSHFEAQDQMEHGASVKGPLGSGWISRWLRSRGGAGALSALALGRSIPESLRGAPSATAVERVDQIKLSAGGGRADAFASALLALYGAGEPTGGDDAILRQAAGDALALLRRIEDLQSDSNGDSDYPVSQLGHSLSQVARLIRGDLGLRVVAVDQGGYDTHVGQGALLNGQLAELGEALAAFDANLGSLRERVTLVCLTEFGRRVYENTGLGTDHGRASCGFLLGGGVHGGRVVTDWPGLSDEDVEEPGNLRVTLDYRDVLWEVLERRFAAQDHDAVFPGHTYRRAGAMT